MLNRLAVVAVAVACGGDATAPKSAPTANGTATVDASTGGVGAKSGPEQPVDVRGAIPAWQAVVDRAMYLERRGGLGVVRGVVGSQATPFVWLIDETEGSGSLAIRMSVPAQVAVASGDRIAVACAWSLDDSRNWYWRASQVTVLPSSQLPDVTASPPAGAKGAAACGSSTAGDCRNAIDGATNAQGDHSIRDGELPPNARPISLAKQGDAAYFAVVGSPPILDGDGWLIADAPRGLPLALINMPGERASFGGQDFRAPSERWQLQRGETYWVRIGPVRRRAADKLATINARTPPIRVIRLTGQTGR